MEMKRILKIQEEKKPNEKTTKPNQQTFSN